ncbi:MAG: energy transducer TonB [Candidatus Eremiobacteraeota bacterium]|nr:energy transducer TonB [Candidatus Eremiobacteraeota bacterium]
MNRSSRVAIAAGIVAFALSFAPAHAQYTSEYTPARRLSAGTTTEAIVGTGVVVLQVQVNADGTHKVTKIIRSTNAGNNAAATEIANSATYRPARRGKKAVVSFYDYTLKFNGKQLAGESDSGALGPIRTLIRSGNYALAKSRASMYVLGNPGDIQGRTLLGLADYYTGDNPGSAAAFAGVSPLDKRYVAVAAHAFANAAVSLAVSNPNLALSYAQKGFALDHSPNSQFALGVALLNSGKPADAVIPLKAARDAAFGDKGTDLKSKINLDTALMTAYQKTGDVANATAIATEIKRLDPTSTVPSRVIGSALLQQARDQRTAKAYDAAVKLYDQAAAAGDPAVAVTADAEAAFTLSSVAKPDYTKIKSYADKAIAVDPDDAIANYAEAVAYTGLFVTVTHKDADKASATSYANKAIAAARKAGNEALALSIEQFVKTNIK